MTDVTERNNLAGMALRAGGDDWGLFETGGGEHPWLELQRVDFPEDHDAIFDSDIDAWRHVIKLAGEGSPPEKAALGYLCMVSFEEIVGIFHSLYYGEYRTYLRPRKYPTRICRDEDCPNCSWPETYAEVDFSKPTPGADAIGCSKCGWRITAGEQ